MSAGGALGASGTLARAGAVIAWTSAKATAAALFLVAEIQLLKLAARQSRALALHRGGCRDEFLVKLRLAL